MDDNLSVESTGSTASSDEIAREFDFVGDKPGDKPSASHSRTPILDYQAGLRDLKEALSEALREPFAMEEPVDSVDSKDHGFHGVPVDIGKDPLAVELSPTEKQDSMKPDLSSEDEGSMTYLGAAQINAPKSEAEIHRNMAILNEQSTDQGIKVSISVPSSSQGIVVLYDAATNSVISRYEIHRIIFYARGPADSKEASCFAFTWSHGETLESAIFQCHVFRCDIAEAVARVSACFAKAFQRVPRSMSSSVTSAADMSASVTTIPETRNLVYVFEVTLEIKEDDGRGSYSTVGKDKSGFRLKTNLEKQLSISIRQVSESGPQLTIERCFGVLVASGKDVKHSDMRLLEMTEQLNQNAGTEKNLSIISATWDPTEKSFEELNCETPKEVNQFMTVAVDLVIRGIQEPVRFQIETLVKICGQNERNFWYFPKKQLVQQFFLNLKEISTGDLNDIYYEVLSMETSGELDRNLLNLNLNLSNLIQSPSINSIETLTPKEEECVSDGDEPLLSGTGLVSKDCSVDVLDNWAEVLARWKSTKQRPKQLAGLVRMGIPEALRGEVWQRLAGVEEESYMMENYRLLITKESSCEEVIQRDIARTFPANDFFKDTGGLGQDSLYRVSKAYAVYDSEVGYCQGLSFLAATLLLHMPEEQAFCVLVKLMYGYGLRDLYKDGFDNLYLRLYQLNMLMKEQLQPLWLHFNEHSIETHMFASQWFLTLFTAKFPLYFVFHIIDIFLLQGIETLFQMALALLMVCKKDLMQLDFEGILKYFRVSLPKKWRNEEAAKQLIKLACSIKVKKLKKYEADFIASKEEAETAAAEATEVDRLRATASRLEEERKLLLDEVTQLKEMLKREVDQSEADRKNHLTAVGDFKMARQRFVTQLDAVRAELDCLKVKVSTCEECSQYLKKNASEPLKSSSDQINDEERVRALELELAQTKLAHVEAECRNQNLTHQLRATELELNTAKISWPPWLSKTLISIKEVANKKDFSNFAMAQQNSVPNTTPSFISHINNLNKREPTPVKREKNKNRVIDTARRESAPVIKDTQSCSGLKNN